MSGIFHTFECGPLSILPSTNLITCLLLEQIRRHLQSLLRDSAYLVASRRRLLPTFTLITDSHNIKAGHIDPPQNSCLDTPQPVNQPDNRQDGQVSTLPSHRNTMELPTFCLELFNPLESPRNAVSHDLRHFLEKNYVADIWFLIVSPSKRYAYTYRRLSHVPSKWASVEHERADMAIDPWSHGQSG
jgi:hypothetical protein